MISLSFNNTARDIIIRHRILSVFNVSVVCLLLIYIKYMLQCCTRQKKNAYWYKMKSMFIYLPLTKKIGHKILISKWHSDKTIFVCDAGKLISRFLHYVI